MYKHLTFNIFSHYRTLDISFFFNSIEENRVGGTVAVIDIFSFFCIPIRYSAAMAPSLNYIWIHECLVFHVVSELPIRNALFGIKAD
jgi:hypothetical protein